ncbi:MAG: CoB--CoM heterodisulfide reductase iron-sulfur subunit B family protein [bacterium]
MKYALFLGCTIPVRAQNYEISARAVAKELGIEFEDLTGFACCAYPVRSASEKAATLIAARNLAVAEEKGLEICTLCSACTATLTEMNEHLKSNEEARKEVNEYLEKIGREYKGVAKVRHFARILYEDVGLDKIKSKVKKDLSSLTLAPHYGCHYIKPSEVYGHFDSPENPHTLSELITVTGAKLGSNIPNSCCGGAIIGVDVDITLTMARTKLDAAQSANVDAVVSICPFCSVIYEDNQKKVQEKFEKEYGIPVLFYPQILGLALGIGEKELAFRMNKVKPKDLLAKITAEAA